MKQGKWHQRLMAVLLVIALLCSTSVFEVRASQDETELSVAVESETGEEVPDQNDAEETEMVTETEAALDADTMEADGSEGDSGDQIAIDEAHFPDEVFRAFIANSIDADGDGYLSSSEIKAVETIEIIEDDSIKSLRGIELFTSLKRLRCSWVGGLTELDVTGCKSLRYLYCLNGNLNELNVTGCKSLWCLDCSNNQLTELDLTGCESLEALYCDGNQLTEIDVTGCESLVALGCRENQLTEIDVTRCELLKYLYCYGNQLTGIDVTGCESLEDLECGGNQLTEIDVTGCESLKYLYCYGNQLTEIDVTGCESLEDLECGENQLTEIDVTGCESLKYLHCYGNQLTELDLTGCESLEYLDCSANQLTELDLTGCTRLSSLLCSVNQIKELDISNNSYLIDNLETYGLYESDEYKICLDDDNIVIFECDESVTIIGFSGDQGGEEPETDPCEDGHDYAGEISKEATCTSYGETVYTCSRCGDSYSEVIAKLEHSIITDVAVAPTCTSTGLSEGSHCSVCGETNVAQEIVPRSEHVETVEVVKAATATEDGQTVKKCSVCGEELEDPQMIYKASKITLSKTKYVYDGKAKTPALTVKDSQGNTISSEYYTVKKSSGRKNVGKYTYTVTLKGNYKGTVKKTFTIVPKGATILAPAAGSKSFTAKWKKQASKMATSTITGYQVRYSTKSSMASAKTKTVKGYAKTSLKIGSLKAKTKYYVQVRTYKTVNGVKYYSSWSAKKAVTTK